MATSNQSSSTKSKSTTKRVTKADLAERDAQITQLQNELSTQSYRLRAAEYDVAYQADYIGQLKHAINETRADLEVAYDQQHALAHHIEGLFNMLAFVDTTAAAISRYRGPDIEIPRQLANTIVESLNEVVVGGLREGNYSVESILTDAMDDTENERNRREANDTLRSAEADVTDLQSAVDGLIEDLYRSFFNPDGSPEQEEEGADSDEQ
jgi:chromosome segregation ATPase